MAALDQRIANLVTGIPNTYEIHVNGEPINIDVNLNDLIEAGKFTILETNDSLTQIPNKPGNYWILTTEPVKHSLNSDFNHRPEPIEIKGVKYYIIYNGQSDNIPARIKQHCFNDKIKQGDMSGISIDIFPNNNNSDLKHNKTIYKINANNRTKIPFIEHEQRVMTYSDIPNLWCDNDEQRVIDYCNSLTPESIVCFKNGINIEENKHSQHNWIVVYYDMDLDIYHPISDVIEQRWRVNFGQPILCSYKSGR